MRKLSEYDLVADGIETILSIRRPTIKDNFSGLNPRVLMPPVTMMEELVLDSNDEFFHPAIIPPDLLSYINIATITPRNDLQQGLMIFNWVRTASPRQRRNAKFASKYMVLLTNSAIFEGRWVGFETKLLSFINNKWRDAIGARLTQNVFGDVSEHTPSFDAHDNVIRISFSVALNLRYCYSAVLSDNDDYLSARIYAYPETIRYLLRTRNVGNVGRRRALVHLVRMHKRRRRAATHAVSSHLRGEHRCQWQGMNVAVLPSQYDMEHTPEGAVKERLTTEGLRRWVGGDGP